MNFALGYIIQRFLYRIGDFLRHWYIKSARMYWNKVIDMLQEIDYVLAWRLTAKNFFLPLFGDYSAIGYVLGFLFRTVRVIVGSVIYLVIFAIAGGIYVAWLAIPPFIIYKAFF